MQIERHRSRPRQPKGCGCAFIATLLLTTLVIAGFLLAPLLPSLALRLAGFEPLENTAPAASAALTAPPPTLSSAVRPASIRLSAGEFGQIDLPASANYSIQIGQDANGSPRLQITMDAANILALCQQYSTACSEHGQPFRRAAVSLHSGSVRITAEAFIDLLNTWQPLDLQLSLNSSGSIQIDSIGIDGTRYRLPDNPIGQQLQEALATANQIRSQLAVQANGATYRLAEVIITPNQLAAVFR